MTNYKAVIDNGHGIIKSTTASGNLVAFRHAIAQLSESQFERVTKLYGIAETPLDYIRINDTPYVVGQNAERFSMTRRSGSGRYSPDYYGVMTMASLIRLYQPGSFEVELFCSHPPGHVDYVDELFKSVLGQWQVEARGKRYSINVVYVDAFDEPTGGMMNVILSKDGTSYQNLKLRDQKILVIDVGHGTTDSIIYEQGIDYGTTHTIELGISQVISNFESEFKARHKAATKNTMTLDPRKIRQAIVTGEFTGGGQTYACHEEAQQSKNLLLNQILQHIQSSYGGGFNFDGVLLTGGGSALLYNELSHSIDNENVMLADEDLEQMHFANVKGGLKLWKMFEALGA